MSKIIALWSCPRSCSNAFLKTFYQRQDTEIVHEPFGDIYYYSKLRRSKSMGDNEKLLNLDSEKVIKRIKSVKASVTFFKDFPYEALPYIDKSFINDCLNTFLLRNPKEVIASWYRVAAYDPTEEELGFVALEKMWNIVTNDLKKKPILVEANRFRSDPETILKSYCQEIGIEFDPAMLQWNDSKITLGHSHPQEHYQPWRKTFQNSKTILPPQPINVKIRTQDIEMIERAMTIYEKLASLSL